IKTCGDSLSESSEVISTSSVRDAVPLRGQKGKLLCATFPTFFDVAFHVRRSSVPPAPDVGGLAYMIWPFSSIENTELLSLRMWMMSEVPVLISICTSSVSPSVSYIIKLYEFGVSVAVFRLLPDATLNETEVPA